MIGVWHNIKGRCDYCGRFMTKGLFRVSDPIQGNFCSGAHAREAARQMQDGITNQELENAKEIHGG